MNKPLPITKDVIRATTLTIIPPKQGIKLAKLAAHVFKNSKRVHWNLSKAEKVCA